MEKECAVCNKSYYMQLGNNFDGRFICLYCQDAVDSLEQLYAFSNYYRKPCANQLISIPPYSSPKKRQNNSILIGDSDRSKRHHSSNVMYTVFNQ